MKQVEVEGGEISLKNSYGDIVIIPKNKASWVKQKLSEGCHGCIDGLVESLPSMRDYAQDGTIIPNDDDILPSWEKVKATLNPYNWGVDNYSKEKDFNSAYSKARASKKEEFMYKDKRYSTNMKNLEGQRITHRDDYKGNFLSYTASGGRRAESYGDNAMGDVYRYYGGLPLKSNELGISKYKPTTAKDSSLRYISINNTQFLKDLDYYSSIAFDDIKRKEFNDKRFQEMKKLNSKIIDEDYEKVVPFKTIKEGTTYTFPTGSGTTGDKNSSRAMGNMFISKGKDDRGNYISYYDVFNKETGAVTSETGEGWATKPFEVYDRVYKKQYQDGKTKTMYYTDDELSKMESNKKDFDGLALQKELSNRGYKLPKSTTKEGIFDGIYGDETKNALIKYQKSLNTKK